MKNTQKTLSEIEKKITNREFILDDQKILDFSSMIINQIKSSGHKIRTLSKNKTELMLNYYYWLMRIERRVVFEMYFSKDNLSNPNQYKKVMKYLISRLNDCTTALYMEYNLEIEKFTKISNESFALQMSGHKNKIYCSLELLHGLEIKIDQFDKKSNYYERTMISEAFSQI